MNLFAAVLSPFRGQGLARAFQHRDFSVFITGHWVSAVGLWVQRVAVGWLTWELTHSGAWLGGVALAQALLLNAPKHAAIATALPLVAGGPRRLVHGVFSTLMRRAESGEAALPATRRHPLRGRPPQIPC